VVSRRPTVVAFFPPVTPAQLNKDPDTDEALHILKSTGQR
jgi:hypothetical protein